MFEEETNEDSFFTLSDEALGAVMMALQKSLMEQSDIVPTLKGFKFKSSEDRELYILNPPIFKLNEELLQEQATE